MKMLKPILFAPLFGIAGILMAYCCYFVFAAVLGFLVPALITIVFSYESSEVFLEFVGNFGGIQDNTPRFSNLTTLAIFILGAVIGVWYSFDNTIFDKGK